ncbi:hypothetical protein AYY19_13995 [Photobacterium aquimaris]|nr:MULTISPECIES: DUF11 domain-containing protein [Photobacterium]OBU15803.1 hypothetical protein AYY20_06890 [Photobacterium aquimaris]OBU17357.1 hypothetical protein AYY19_13995 [Photobacterium aquimaris]
MKTHLKPISMWVAAGLITVGAGSISSQALAATAAGTDIKNLATVTYEDTSGNSYTATSNEAIVTVKQIYSATIEKDLDVPGAPGQTVYLPHVLTNTGNGIDTYTLTFGQNLPTGDTRGPDTQDATSIKLYPDTDGNGEPDPGKPPISSGDTVTINGGSFMKFIIAASIDPTTAIGETIGVQIEAEAHEGTGGAVDGSVSDPIGNNDSANDTNGDLITVTNDAVLNMTKSADHLENLGTEQSLGVDVDGDPSNDLPVSLIRYTVTVKNNGNTAAKDVVIFDGIPDGTTLVTASSGALYDPTSTLQTSSNDTLITSVANLVNEGSHGVDLDQDGATDSNEADIGPGIDLNGNGNTSDSSLPGVYAIDKFMDVGNNMTMTFYVAYSPDVISGDTDIGNVAYSCADLNGDGDFVDDGECGNPDPTKAGPDTTNPTTTPTTSTTGVGITDTGPETGTSGGGDTDGSGDGIQTVGGASSGSDVFFYNKIINNGNKVDSFDLATVNTSFPPLTGFQYWNADGTGQLVDTNGHNGADTGPVQPATCDNSTPATVDGITVNCNEVLIRVVAKLPADAADYTAPFDATTTATSFNDKSKSGSKIERLATITGPTVDIANSPITDVTPGTNLDPFDVSDGFTSADVATTFNEPLGTTVMVPLYIANEGGSSDSFILRAEGSYDGAGWLPTLPQGWTVIFKHNGIDIDHSGAVDIPATGAAITSTPLIPGGGVLWVTAEITIPLDPTLALADSQQPSAIDANGDSDLDYIISMVVESAGSGATDRKVEAFDIDNAASIDISPASLSEQVEPGGNVGYEHTLSNNGNTTETVDLSSSNNTPGFNNTVMIDIDGDGTPDKEIGNLCDAPVVSPISVLQAGTGVATDIEVTCDATDGSDTVPSLTIEPGETVELFVTVFAPGTATSGTTNITTINAVSTTDPSVNATGLDNSEVVKGQVRLYKFTDIDVGCDGNGESDMPKNFQKQHTTRVAPGDCVVWKLVAINEGSSTALNTVITDKRTEYTQFSNGGSGDLVQCRNSVDTGAVKFATDADYALKTEDLGPLCNPDSTTGADVTPLISGDTVTFTVNDLEPGDRVVSHFVVEVD